MKSSALMLLVSMLMLMGLPAAAPAGLREAAQQVGQGVEAFRGGDYKAAAAAFEAAEGAAPDDQRIAFDRACALAAAGEADKAGELFQKAALARDKQLVAACHYNLGCLAVDKVKALFGSHPEEAAPEVRDEGLQSVAVAVGHFRDCLGVAPDHADARYNLESLRLWLKHIQAVWLERDRQKRRDEMNLLDFLQWLESEQRTLRSATQALSGVPASPKQRQEVRTAVASQRSLAEEIGPVKEKIRQALTAPAQAPGAATAAPQAAPPTQATDANTQRAVELLSGLADEAALSMEHAANRLADQSFAAARQQQTAAVEKLDDLFLGVAPYANLVQKAITVEQGLVDQSSGEAKSEETGAGGRGPGAGDKQKEKPQPSHKDEPDAAEAAWNQRFITRYSQILPAKARRELEQLGGDAGQELGARGQGLGARAEGTGAGEQPQSGTSTQEDEQPQPPQKDEQDKQQAQKEERKRALKKGIDLAPLVETLSTDAAALLEEQKPSEALPKQEEALKLLDEMLPKDEQQKQQDQKDEKQKDQQKDKKDQQKQQPKDEKKDQKKKQPKDQPKDQQKKQEQKQQQKDQQTQQPRDLSKQQAEAVLRRIHQREQQREDMEKELQRFLYRPDKVEKDW